MKIQKKKISDLLPAGYNPRKDLQPGDSEYEKLKRSIQEFDYVDPVIWNQQTGTVLGGHQRLKVLKDLGHTEVEVSVVDLPLEKEMALNVALNKVSGDWDTSKLSDLMLELQGMDIDMELTGFTEKELNNFNIFGEDDDNDTNEDNEYEELEFQYKIMIMCKDEYDQIRILEMLENEHIECRPLIS